MLQYYVQMIRNGSDGCVSMEERDGKVGESLRIFCLLALPSDKLLEYPLSRGRSCITSL